MSLKKLKQQVEQETPEQIMTEEDLSIAVIMIEHSLFAIYGGYIVYCRLNDIESKADANDIGEYLTIYSSSSDKDKLIEENPSITFYKFLKWYLNEDNRN